MQERLKNFIQENKHSFDELEPGSGSWAKIEAGLKEKKQSGASVLPWQKILVAASLLALVFSGIALYNSMVKPSTDNTNISGINDTTPSRLVDTNNNLVTTPGSDTNREEQLLQPAEQIVPQVKQRLVAGNADPNEALGQYTKLIESKQHQLGILKEAYPELYQRFSEDLKALEFSYEALKEKAAKGANRQLVLEAMIQNLEYQSALLNRQLDIIKHINETKNQSNETPKNTL